MSFLDKKDGQSGTKLLTTDEMSPLKSAPTLAGTIAKKAGFYVAIGAIVTGMSSYFLSGNDDPAKGRTLSDSPKAAAARDALFKAHGLKQKSFSPSHKSSSFPVDKGDLQLGALTALLALGASGYGRLKRRDFLARDGVTGFWNQMTHMDGLSGAVWGLTHAEHMANHGGEAFSRSVVATLRNDAKKAQAAKDAAEAKRSLQEAAKYGKEVARKLQEADEMALSSWKSSLSPRWFPRYRNDRLAYSTVEEQEVEVVIKTKTGIDPVTKEEGKTTIEKEEERGTKYREYAKAAFGENNGAKYRPPARIPRKFYSLKAFD